MAAEATLKLNLVGHDKSASRALQGVGREAHQTQGKLAKFGAIGKTAALGIAGALAGVGVAAIQFGADAVSSASEAEQSLGGVDAVFGKQAKGIKESADGAASSLGLSANEYRQFATVLGAGLKNKGIKDYADQTESLIGVGADLAAQFGGSTSDAVDALASAMRGESDPIEKYGVSLNETAVNAELAARGQSKLKGAALDQAKAQARLAIISKQTADAQGAFSRESDTLANKQQRSAAAFENLKARIGQGLLPAMEGLTDAGQGVLDWLDKNPEVVAGATAAFGLLGDALSGLWDIVRHYVAPALGWLLHGQAAVARGTADMLDALGNIPGFEWAKGAAEKVRGIATGMDAVASGLEALAKDSPEVTVETKAAQKNVADVQTKIDGIKGKIVTAKAKGDDKELERLQRKLAKAEKKKWTLSVRARAISGGGWKITGNVSGAGDRYTLKAFRQGGRPRVGELAYFHADELWIPDEAGTVVSQARTRAMRGTGPTPMPWAGGSGGGDVYHVNIDARGSLSDIDFGGAVDRALTKLVRARRGRAPQFQLAVAR